MNFKNLKIKSAFVPVVFLILLSLTFFQAPNAFACRCALPFVENALSGSDAVFAGKVSKLKYLDDPQQASPEPRVIVTFDVSQWWKGSNGKQAVLHTVYNTFTCNGYWFEDNEEYLVYASKKEDGTFGTSFCRRTNILAQATEDLALLGKGTPPVNGAQDPGQTTTPTPAPAAPPASAPTTTSNNFSSEIVFVGIILLVIIGVIYKILASRKGISKS